MARVQGLIEEMVGIWAMDWFICMSKAYLQRSQSLSISKNWLALGWSISPGTANSQDAKALNTEARKFEKSREV